MDQQSAVDHRCLMRGLRVNFWLRVNLRPMISILYRTCFRKWCGSLHFTTRLVKQRVTDYHGRKLRPMLTVHAEFENNYFTETCSGSEAGSYVTRMDFVYHSTLGSRVIKKLKRGGSGLGLTV